MQNKSQPLSEEEIHRAKYIVDVQHPLTEVPIYKALPFLAPLKAFFKKKIDQERRQLASSDSLAKNNQAKGGDGQKKQQNKNQYKQNLAVMVKSEDRKDQEANKKGGPQALPPTKPQFEEEEDPVHYLGFGIVSYFNLLKICIFIFLVITVLHIPVMKIYKSYNNYNEDVADKLFKVVSLGNMGFSTTKCTGTGLAADKIILSCKTGVVNRIFDFSFSGEFEDHDLCVRNTTGVCDANAYDPIKLRKDLETNCLGKQSCKIQGLKSYINQAKKKECTTDDAQFSVQFYCEQTKTELNTKKNQGVLVASIAVFSALFFIIMIYYLKNHTIINQVEWDVATTTAGDYTVDLKISPGQYNHFMHQIYRPGGDPAGYQLKQYLKDELENDLTTKVPSQGFEEYLDRVRIADIQLSFKNGSLIKGLRARGIHIKNNNWKGLNQANDNLDKVKTIEYQNLKTPVGVFITFESEEGLQRCLASPQHNIQVLGSKAILDKAPEPTNIIWENRQYTSFQRFLRLLLAVFVILILLSISFATVVTLKKMARDRNMKYRRGDCAEQYEINGPELMQDYAVQEWFDYYQPAPGVIQNSISSIVDCFCKQQAKQIGKAKLAFQVYKDKDGKSAQVCHEWLIDMYAAKAFNIIISVSINVINIILKLIMIMLISNICEDTKSKMMSSIKIGVFIGQFFNTGFVLLLASANLKETYFPVLNEVVRSQFTDFNSNWYRDVGANIVKTVLISAFVPIFEFGGIWAMRHGLRALDRSFGKDHLKSKKKSIQLYIDLYSGPEYLIHFRYSSVMNTCFVCLMYGTALPILYPIAFLAFINLYILEKCLVCYYYKQPPVFDEKMTMSSLKMLTWAPVLYMAFSYWLLGNNQIFDNVIFSIKYVDDILLSGHTIITDISNFKIDQSFPPLVAFFSLLFLIPFSAGVSSLIDHFSPGCIGVNLNVDENLPNYFEALEKDDKLNMIAEEDNMRKNYRIKVLLDDTYNKLKKAGTAPKGNITGVHYYDILANPIYVADFQYVPADVPNRDLMIQDDDEDESNDAIQCDIVRIGLNIAMLQDDKAQQLSFNKAKAIQVLSK